MGTLHLSQTALTSVANLPRTAAAAPPAAGALGERVLCTLRDGLRWWHVSTAAPLLERLGRVWARPAEQGWQRVKQNARREVWRAVLDGLPYYLKYYYRESGVQRLRHLVRPRPVEAEWAGGLYARQFGIAAARPLAYTLDVQRGGRRCALLISEAVEPAEPLNAFWPRLALDGDVVRRRRDVAQLCDRLGELIARAHQAGFEHLDMHAGNILVQTLGPRQYRAVFIDLQSARRGVPLSDRAVVRNLAQLNQWFRRHSSVKDRLRFLRAYLRWRLEYEQSFDHARPLNLDFARLVRALQRAAGRHAGRLGARRDHRVTRSGRYFSRLKLPGGWRGAAVATCKHASEESRASHLVFTPEWWCAQLATPLRWFDEPSDEDCKRSHSGIVRRAVLRYGAENLPVILKRPLARSTWRRFVQLWPPSRSVRAWRTGHALLHRDVPTARPLAVLEQRRAGLVRDSLLVTEAIPGGLDLEAYLRWAGATLPPAEWAALKRELTRRLATLVRQLGERGFEHRDCKATNVLVVPHAGLKLLWIDLDGIRLRRWWRPYDPLRAVVRLHVSLEGVPGLTRTDRARFLKAYFAGYGTRADAWRAAWPRLAAAAGRKARAKAARRAWKLRHYGRE